MTDDCYITTPIYYVNDEPHIGTAHTTVYSGGGEGMDHSSTSARVFQDIDTFSFDQALRDVEAVVRHLNRYVERNAPWARSKEGDHEAVRRVLYNASEALRLVSVLLHPVMPGKTRELWHSLGWTLGSDLSEGLDWGGLLPGSRVTLRLPLFPRIDQRPNLLPG